jgi:hypothetical protein
MSSFHCLPQTPTDSHSLFHPPCLYENPLNCAGFSICHVYLTSTHHLNQTLIHFPSAETDRSTLVTPFSRSLLHRTIKRQPPIRIQKSVHASRNHPRQSWGSPLLPHGAGRQPSHAVEPPFQWSAFYPI